MGVPPALYIQFKCATGYLSSLDLRESASIHCHLRLQNSLFLTADDGRLTQINADELDLVRLQDR